MQNTYMCVQYTIIFYYGAEEKVEDAINLKIFNIFVDESRSFLYQARMSKTYLVDLLLLVIAVTFLLVITSTFDSN